MNETFLRIALPSGIVLFTGLALVLPMLRHRRQHGSGTGFVIADVKDPVGRLVGYGMTLNSNFVGIHAALFAAFGGEPLSVLDVPVERGYVGIALMLLATTLIVTSQAELGRNWRMCIDENRTDLVTSGLYQYVRNPIYTGTILLLLGVLALAPGPWAVLLLVFGTYNVALQARLEEAHLVKLHGDTFLAYASKVGRFLPGVGRVSASEPSDVR